MATLFGVPFTSSRFDELVTDILADGAAPDAPCRFLVTANVDHIVRLRIDEEFRQAYGAAWRITMDGAPIALTAALAGLPTAGRAPGADLFAAVMDRLDPARHRPAFLVSDEALASRVRAWLADRRFPTERTAVLVPPYGFDRNPDATQTILREIASCHATHVSFAVGAPRSEKFVYRHRASLKGVVALCVGAGIAFYLGTQRRAPAPWRTCGFEWLWRLLSEPRRLFRRYLIDSAPFFRLALAEIVAHRWRRARPRPGIGPGRP
jgi:N-acetylglucosaminyldiphosphoundecaprenol N-acetyl-beta-D-mannosaminyltransferase